MMKVNQTQITI